MKKLIFVDNDDIQRSKKEVKMFISPALQAYGGLDDGVPFVEAFIEGYKAAQAKQFTEEDLRKAINMAQIAEYDGIRYMGLMYSPKQIIDSLKPKVEIEIEMEEKSHEEIQKELGTWGHDEGLTEREYDEYKANHSILKPKTYEKDGKTFLKI